MKANELMIGDWFKYSKGNYTDSRQISLIDIEMYCEGIIFLYPIPLTAEILEKNGFVYNDMPFAQSWEQFGLSIYGDGLINCGQNVALQVKYVHQLQHALHLCGIEKNIEP